MGLSRHQNVVPAPGRSIAAVAILTGWAVLAHRMWFVCDDAWISFRFARNWAAGQGVRYNLGSQVPVEGYSNFLWVAVAALCETLGASPGFWLPLISAACAVILLGATYRVLRRDLRVDWQAAVLACAAMAWSPVFAVWTSGGLETMATALCLFVCFQRWVLAAPGTSRTLGYVAALALTMLRTEGLLWVMFVGALALVVHLRGPSFRIPGRDLRGLAALVLGFALYTAWRVQTYESWLSNTARTKAALGLDTAAQGLIYIVALALSLVVPVLFYAGAWPAIRRHGLRGLALSLMALAPLAYAVLVGGDYMTMGRLLLPALPFAVLLLGLLLQSALAAIPRALVVGAMALVLLAGVGPAFDRHLTPDSVRASFHFRQKAQKVRSEYEQWQFQRANVARWREKARALKQVTAQGDSLVSGGIGILGYDSDLFIYDVGGLVNRDVAARPILGDRDEKSPGHEKTVHWTYFLDQAPTILQVEMLKIHEAESQAGRILRRWRRQPAILSRYAPRIDRVEDSPDTLVMQLRRVPAGVDAAAAWASFPGQVEALTASTHAPALNVVLIVVDTLRADHVGAYGAARPTTPAMDALARRGVLFRRAYSPAPWTKPAVASILTGRYPSGHGAFGARARLSPEMVTLTEVLGEQGYATAGVISGKFLSATYRLNQGFHSYDEEESARAAHEITSQGVTRRALARAEQAGAGQQPLFLFVHYFDPHYNYRNHAEIDFAPASSGRLQGLEDIHDLRAMTDNLTREEIDFLLACYDEEIRFTDAAIGDLLAGLEAQGLTADNTLFLLTSDHGEEFLERGWLGHTRTLYDELLRVPLIMVGPENLWGAGRVIHAPVSTVSIMPTVLDVLGRTAEGFDFQAGSLLALAGGAGGDTSMHLLAEVDFKPILEGNAVKTAFKKAIMGPEFKLIRDDRSGALELYNLVEDPREMNNLIDQEPRRTAELATLLTQTLARVRREGAVGDDAQLDQEQIETLRSLGYVGEGGEEQDRPERD